MRSINRTYRSALITGSSSGIGTAFAYLLPQNTHLVLAGRDPGRLEQVSAQLSVAGRRVDVVAADLATAGGRNAVAAAAKAAAIDLFVCNAGLATAGDFGVTPLTAERDTIAVNIVATVELLHSLLPFMLRRAVEENRRAGIIIVSSTAAFGPRPGLATYAASKAFQLHLAEALSAELKHQPIDILALCPTRTETAFFARAGLPPPGPRAISPETVAREGLHALGRTSVHVCRPRQTGFKRLLRTVSLPRWRARVIGS
jgi:uncharacterized protein